MCVIFEIFECQLHKYEKYLVREKSLYLYYELSLLLSLVQSCANVNNVQFAVEVE